jgi:hypothetical protein
MPLSDPDFIVQYATGTVFSAASTDTLFNITLPSAATYGNAVLFFIAGQPGAPSNNGGFYGSWGVSSTSTGGAPSATWSLFSSWSRIVVTQTNTFAFYIQANSFSVAQHGAWLAVEVRGAEPDWQGSTPWSNDDCGVKFTSTGQSQNHDQTGTATSINTGTAANTDHGPMLFVAPFVCSTTSATPPAMTGFSNNGAQPGSWQQLGATVATTDAGHKLRLDVAYKIVDDYGPYSCQATYASAPLNMAAAAAGLFGDRIAPQQVQGRAATNSMM